MNVTAAGLTQAAGAAAVAAGAIFVAVQIGHPGPGTFTTETSQWVARSVAKVVMAALALAGITGMYVSQHRTARVLGLVGYVVLALGYLAMLSVEMIAATVLPNLTSTEPAFVDDVVTAATGGHPQGDIGALQTLFTVAGLAYLAGGVLFGLALFRARVLARWAAALLVLGALGTAALAVLPESFNRPMAVPAGVAMIGLGVSLWRSRSAQVAAPSPALAAATR